MRSEVFGVHVRVGMRHNLHVADSREADIWPLGVAETNTGPWAAQRGLTASAGLRRMD